MEFLVEEGEELAEGRRLASAIGAHSEIATVTNKAGVRAAMEGGLTNGLAMECELCAFPSRSARNAPGLKPSPIVTESKPVGHTGEGGSSQLKRSKPLAM